MFQSLIALATRGQGQPISRWMDTLTGNSPCHGYQHKRRQSRMNKLPCRLGSKFAIWCVFSHIRSGTLEHRGILPMLSIIVGGSTWSKLSKFHPESLKKSWTWMVWCWWGNKDAKVELPTYAKRMCSAPRSQAMCDSTMGQIVLNISMSMTLSKE